jgi:hypothetical protein
MDISLYISELLFEHDCVIIPNFGGFICNYKPADIHPVQNTIAPPAKIISFNRSLQSNDGLLVNHIALRQSLSFDSAAGLVEAWVNSGQALLTNRETLFLKRIGKLTADAEGKIQFAPVTEVNYLKTSYALKTITVQPVMRHRERHIEFTEKFVQETKHITSVKSTWRIAATVLLLITMVALAELMWMGVAIKPLQLNQAGVFSFVSSIFKTTTPELKPIPVEVENTPVVTAIPVPEITTEPVTETTAIASSSNNTPANSNGPVYYIIIGAFADPKNVIAAKERLQQRFPNSIIFEERGKRLTRLGYSVGNIEQLAEQKLTEAKVEDQSYWLMKK